MQIYFLTEVDLRFLHKFCENAESHSFDKDKQAWQLIISFAQAFDSLRFTFSRYYHT